MAVAKNTGTQNGTLWKHGPKSAVCPSYLINFDPQPNVIASIKHPPNVWNIRGHGWGQCMAVDPVHRAHLPCGLGVKSSQKVKSNYTEPINEVCWNPQPEFLWWQLSSKRPR